MNGNDKTQAAPEHAGHGGAKPENARRPKTFVFVDVEGPMTEQEARELRELVRDLSGVAPSDFDGVRDRAGRFRSYVHFAVPTEEDAVRVVRALHGQEFRGRRIKVKHRSKILAGTRG